MIGLELLFASRIWCPTERRGQEEWLSPLERTWGFPLNRQEAEGR